MSHIGSESLFTVRYESLSTFERLFPLEVSHEGSVYPTLE